MKRKRNQLIKDIKNIRHQTKQLQKQIDESEDKHVILSNNLEFIEEEIKFNEIMQLFIDEENLTDIIFHYLIHEHLMIEDFNHRFEYISFVPLQFKTHETFIEIFGPFHLNNIQKYSFEIIHYYTYPFRKKEFKQRTMCFDSKLKKINIFVIGANQFINDDNNQKLIKVHIENKTPLLIYKEKDKVVYLSFYFKSPSN